MLPCARLRADTRQDGARVNLIRRNAVPRQALSPHAVVRARYFHLLVARAVIKLVDLRPSAPRVLSPSYLACPVFLLGLKLTLMECYERYCSNETVLAVHFERKRESCKSMPVARPVGAWDVHSSMGLHLCQPYTFEEYHDKNSRESAHRFQAGDHLSAEHLAHRGDDLQSDE